MQLYVPDTATATLVQRQSAHNAVVLPGTFSAGALWGCGFKTGCHEAGSTGNRNPELQVRLKRKHQHTH